MTARQDLAAAVRSMFRLTRHEMSELPEVPAQQVAFVQLPGAMQLKAAIWQGGEWLSDKGKPFPDVPLHWFSIEVGK